MRAFEWRHVVSFEETNLVGNVYYVNHLRWQGRCRELFLRTHAPDVLDRLATDLAIVTVRCSCEYHAELAAFDEVVIRMRLASLSPGRVSMHFEYWLRRDGVAEQLVATGEHEVACMRREGRSLHPAAWPASFAAALEQYRTAKAPQLC
jgi:enediyne biosynthesis thioesterase